MTYEIDFTMTNTRTFAIEADSEEQAKETAENLLCSESFVSDVDDDFHEYWEPDWSTKVRLHRHKLVDRLSSDEIARYLKED